MKKISLDDDNWTMCDKCNGSGEGYYDGSICQVCKGKGLVYLGEVDDYDDREFME